MPKKGYKLTQKHKENISKGKRGKPNGWNGRHLTEDHKRKIVETRIANGKYKVSSKTIEKLRIAHLNQIPWNKGKKLPQFSGKSHWNWRDGITKENHKIRNSIETQLWRNAVFARDNWTCQKSKIKGGKLVSHHIQNFSQFPELRFAIDNGITLSKKKHDLFHKIFGKKNNTREQLDIFLKA